MRRPTSHITVLAAAVALGGCGGGAGTPAEPLRPTGYQAEGLRQELLAYADRVMGQVTRMSHMVLAADSTPAGRAWVQALQADVASTGIVLAVEPDVEGALQDLMVSLAARRSAAAASAPEDVSPATKAVIQAALDTLAADIWRVGEGYYSPEELTALRGRVDAWAKGPGARSATGVVRAADLPAGAGPALGKGLFAPLDEANRQLQETRFLGERALFLAERLPVVSLWHAEAMTWEILAAPDAQRALADFSRLSTSVERLSAEVDRMPALLTEQREAVLAAFDEREGTLRALLDEAGVVVRDVDALTESGERVATLTKDATASLDATLATAERLVATLRDAEAPGGAMSLEVASYEAALGDFRAATEALNEALAKAEGMAGTPRDVIDHAAWRAAQLLVLLFVLLAAYRWAPRLMRRRSDSNG